MYKKVLENVQRILYSNINKDEKGECLWNVLFFGIIKVEQEKQV